MTRESCPVCGQSVEIQGTIAGTNFYIGLDEQEVEQLQAENAVLRRTLEGIEFMLDNCWFDGADESPVPTLQLSMADWHRIQAIRLAAREELAKEKEESNV